MAKPNVLIRSKKNKAAELFNANRLREADSAFAQICQTAPTDVESWAMRGLIHSGLAARARWFSPAGHRARRPFAPISRKVCSA